MSGGRHAPGTFLLHQAAILVLLLTLPSPCHTVPCLGMASGNLGEGAAVALFMFPFLALVILWQLLYLRKAGRE